MRRINFLSLVGGLAMALAVMLAFGPARAAAQQNPNCCDFIVNTSNLPASCFPITIHTTWSNGLTHTVTVTAPGYQTFHLPFNCPPAPALAGVTSVSNCCIAPISYYCGGCLFIEFQFTC